MTRTAKHDIADAVAILAYLFGGGRKPACAKSADTPGCAGFDRRSP